MKPQIEHAGAFITQCRHDGKKANLPSFITPEVASTQRSYKQNKPSTHSSFEPLSAKHGAVAKLIGKKALIHCNLSDLAVTALFDSGAQFSMISRAWKDLYLSYLDV